MILFLVKLLARILVFGVALTYAVRRSDDVKVEPRSALPIVAAVFTLLNVLLYWGLKTVLNIGTLWMLWFLTPFIVNGIILLITDRILRPFKIESFTALARTAGIVTVAHIALHFLEKLTHVA
jgi:uncharacterized membrane protein YvlD (DUF360 family)